VSALGVEPGGFTDLFLREALAANGDAVLAEHGGNTGLGDAVAVSDLFGRVAGLVLQDVVDVVGAEEPFRAGWQAIVA
jgi:hypothetical protein